MNERVHTLDELNKMEATVNYLKSVGLCDDDDYDYIELIINEDENR